MNDLMDKIISLAKRRGFIFPGSEIYGGLANSWDYGPLGVELKNNIKQEWWKWFVQRRSDMVGIDTALIMNPKVWEASGHTKEFTDPLVECKACHQRFRADQVGNTCPNCQGSFTKAQQFNLLFKTFLGPVEDSSAVVYLRGELAQAMFVNFKTVLGTTRKRLPFGIAAQGKVFRNEITPGNFIFRTREFDLMEFEYFVEEKEWEKWFEYWHKEMHAWLAHLGVKKTNLYDHEIPDGERAHYSRRTIDIEYEYPFGRKELYGIAYRYDFDLNRHQEKSGQDLQYSDPETGRKFLPHTVEPTFGVDRSALVALLEAYHEEDAPTGDDDSEKRVVLKFPKWLAPIKVAVLPLSKKENLSAKAKEVYELVRKDFVCEYDETQSIGKRYRRQDEIGTPYCVTVDFESLDDNKVTVRDRDTMKQERIALSSINDYLKNKLS
ncbi:MAG: glycine--tRNA ligase [Candidatus Zambryskibacteria bacterium RIFCSPLOWO2_01_FULL_45_43]|uniref:Glycine--tRNA ligase n=2 Tax=Parcubacteria group TaxID=1794811 RepID=A0A1G1ZTX9_9BACT|nr:MAG: glycine--tRNA ligase [Candidatus Harrisonbacteria bacterium RIFCSPLOWO2_02_FULL_45_10c]OHB05225.1 MAG: glycine--tRNA ligase [Candidatus Zambryskibacteria bacterium RIFCSPLOWO2_01_FULL_45_43]